MAQSRTISKQNSGFKFKWWMAVLAIGLVVATGVLIRLLSQAGTNAYNRDRVYVLDYQPSVNSLHPYLKVVRFNQYNNDKSKPMNSYYEEEVWLKIENYPQAAGTLKANSVPRWVKFDSHRPAGTPEGTIDAYSKCAVLSKLLYPGKVNATMTSITATPPLTIGDNLDLAPTTNCDSPAQG